MQETQSQTQQNIEPVVESSDVSDVPSTDSAVPKKLSWAKRFGIGFGFLSLVFAALVLTSLIFMPKDNTSEAGMLYINTHGYLAEPENTLDAVFIGDSEVYAGYMPLEVWKQYGIATYAISEPGQNAAINLEELRDVLKTQSPQIVMVNLHSLTLTCTALDKLTTYLAQVFPVIENHERWKNLTLRDLDFSVEYTYLDPYKGYYYNDSINGIDNNHNQADYGLDGSFPIVIKNCVKEMKELCDEHGATLVLIGMPSFLNGVESLNVAAHNLANELGVELLDFNFEYAQEVNIDWSHDTLDYGDHVNYYGAKKVSTAIGKYLNNTGLFSDKRNDTSYSQWNEDAEFFDNAIASGNVPQTWTELD